MTRNICKQDDRERDLPNVKGMTLRAIGERWGISGGRVAQVLKELERKADLRVRVSRMPDPLTDDWLIEDMPLSFRTRACLRHEGMRTVGNIRRMTDWDLSRIPNFGRKSLYELRGVIPFQPDQPPASNPLDGTRLWKDS